MFLLEICLRLVGLIASFPFLILLFLCDIARVLGGTILLGTHAESEKEFRLWSGRWVMYVMALK
jgi:hypothetical protein